jgi:hypothetical protein
VEAATGQRPKTTEQIGEVVDRVTLSGVLSHKTLRLREQDHRPYLQVEYAEPDAISGKPSVQRGRKWYVSRFATDSEIVQTCLRACLDSAEHQVREHFKYAPNPGDAPRAIYGPHFSADVLYGICGRRENYDAREDPA